jgi:hypothetical protein
MSPEHDLPMASYRTIIIASFKANVYRFTRLRQLRALAPSAAIARLWTLPILTSKVWS